jgi:lysophospholipase L1-like esterase
VRRPATSPISLLLTCLLLAGCGAAGGTTPGTALPSAPPPGAVHVLAVGDSITEADSPDFDGGDVGPGSWAAHVGGDGIALLGGWAHGGATTGDMLAGVTDEAFGRGADADVLVLMGGNNDVDAHVPFAEAAEHLVAIAAAVHARRVVLSAIAPEDDAAADVVAFNAQLPALAAREGWQLVDPMGGVDDGEGHYRPGTSDDGVHPDEEGAELIGAALHAALVAR